MGRTHLSVSLAIAVVLLVINNAAAQTNTDGFEGSSISSFWTLSGSPSLTSAMAHTGTQSLQMPAGSSIFHAFTGPGYGSVEVYFYDDGVVRSTSSSVGLFPISTSTNSAGPYYIALPYGCSNYENGFSGCDLGNRSVGWHSFHLDYSSTGGDFRIDGAIVGTWNTPIAFSGVFIWNQPGTQTTTFIDDFSVTWRSASCQVDVTPFYVTGEPTTFNNNQCQTKYFGCALDSVASALTSFPTLTNINPVSLNADLQTHNGYDNCKLIFAMVPLLRSTKNAVRLTPSGSYPDYNKYLNDHFCTNRERVILKLNETSTVNSHTTQGTHFVVVTAKNGNDWTVFDPGWKNADPLAALSSLSAHLAPQHFTTNEGTTERTFTVADERSFAPQTSSDLSSLAIEAHSPVELLLTDSNGRRLGYDVQDVFEIPDGSYLRDEPLLDDETGTTLSPGDQYGIKTVYISSPLEGSYNLDIVGVALGTYTIVIRSVASDGTFQENSLAGLSNVGSKASDQIIYSTIPGTAAKVEALVTISSTLDDIKNSRALGLITTSRLADSLSRKIRRASEATGYERAEILRRFKDEVRDYSEGKGSVGHAEPGEKELGDHDHSKHDRSQIKGVAIQVLLNDADSLLEQSGYVPQRGHH